MPPHPVKGGGRELFASNCENLENCELVIQIGKSLNFLEERGHYMTGQFANFVRECRVKIQDARDAAGWRWLERPKITVK